MLRESSISLFSYRSSHLLPYYKVDDLFNAFTLLCFISLSFIIVICYIIVVVPGFPVPLEYSCISRLKRGCHSYQLLNMAGFGNIVQLCMLLLLMRTSIFSKWFSFKMVMSVWMMLPILFCISLFKILPATLQIQQRQRSTLLVGKLW